MTRKLSILAVSSWYPSKFDKLNGIFIKEHLQTISEDFNITVLYVEGDEKLKRLISISENTGKSLTEIIVYFKIFDSPFSLLNKLLKLFLYIIGTLYGYVIYFLKYGKPSIIHVHVLTRVGIIPLILKLILGLPYVISEHYTRYLPEDNSYKKNNFHHVLTKLIVKNALGLTTVSKYLMSSMNSFGLKAKLQFIVPNVLNDAFLSPLEKKTNHNHLQIVHVSTLNPAQKNFSGILNALKIVQIKNIPFTFHVYGGYEPYLSQAKRLAEQNPSLDIKFYGKVDRNKLVNAFSNADVMLLFSNYETQGCVIFESLARGVPVIASDLSAIKEILNPKLGILVERTNYLQLASAIIEFNKSHFDPAYLRNYAISTFSADVIKIKWLSFFEDVFNKMSKDS